MRSLVENTGIRVDRMIGVYCGTRSYFFDSVHVMPFGDFIKTSSKNSLKNQNNDKAYDTPLVGFSSGADPLYEAYKDHVGLFFMPPGDICRYVQGYTDVAIARPGFHVNQRYP